MPYLLIDVHCQLNIVRPDFDESEIIELERCASNSRQTSETVDLGELDDLLVYAQCHGLINIEPSSKPIMRRVVGVALLAAVLNTIIIFLSPCYVDFSDLVDCP